MHHRVVSSLTVAARLFMVIAVLSITAVVSSRCGTKVDPTLLARVRSGSDAIEREGRVVLPLVGDKDIPIVHVLLNGRGPYRFLVDVGGNVVSVRQAVGRAADAVIEQKLSERTLLRLETVSMQGCTFRDVYAVGEPALDVDGVIGFNVFREGLLTIDYPGRVLTWETGALPPPNGRDIVPYELRERMPYVQVRIGARTFWMNLDTGASARFIFPLEAATMLPLSAPLTDGPAVWNQASENNATKAGELAATLILGEHAVERPRILFKEDLDEYLIGSGFLRDYVLTFDTANKRVKMVRRRRHISSTVGVTEADVPLHAYSILIPMVNPSECVPLNSGASAPCLYESPIE